MTVSSTIASTTSNYANTTIMSAENAKLDSVMSALSNSMVAGEDTSFQCPNEGFGFIFWYFFC